MSLEQPKMHYGVWKCDVERYIALFPVESIAQRWVRDNGPSRNYEIHDLNKQVMPEKQPYKRKTLMERCRTSVKANQNPRKLVKHPKIDCPVCGRKVSVSACGIWPHYANATGSYCEGSGKRPPTPPVAPQ